MCVCKSVNVSAFVWVLLCPVKIKGRHAATREGMCVRAQTENILFVEIHRQCSSMFQCVHVWFCISLFMALHLLQVCSIRFYTAYFC